NLCKRCAKLRFFDKISKSAFPKFSRIQQDFIIKSLKFIKQKEPIKNNQLFKMKKQGNYLYT
ncbi:MAG TPA: hypothetical protein PK410_03220, partial [Paludibacteraceae bacterium]|nr:hypothetical protein [Paludibacteraceae bacterium]